MFSTDTGTNNIGSKGSFDIDLSVSYGGTWVNCALMR